MIPALVFAACSTDFDGEQVQNPAQGGQMAALEAVIDNAEESRNSLVDEAGKRFILWSEGDAIGMNGSTSGSNIPASLDDDSAGSQNAVFWYAEEYMEGSVAYAYYPYSANAKIVNGKLTTSLSANQKYMTESVFAPNVTVMVGKPNAEGVLTFVNSCSIIEIRLKGAQLLTALSLRSVATPLAGVGTVKIGDAEPAFVLDGSEDLYEIALDLGKGVQLKGEEATSFYFVIPPGTYSDLQVAAKFDGGEFVRSLTKVHTIKPRHILPTTAFALEPLKVSECTPLNDGALSNCYMIPTTTRGKHSFEAKHINGEAVKGTPVKAALLWEDLPNTVGNVHYDAESGKVLFSTSGSGQSGNALISLFDAEMNILWSWHIWVSDSEDQVLGASRDVTILDRNLGARYAPKSAAEVAAMSAYQAAESAGLFYQWGRNTPLPGPMTLDSYYATKNFSIQNKWGYEAKSFSSNTERIYVNKHLGKEYKFENMFFDSSAQTIEAAAASPMAMIHGKKGYIHTWAADLQKVNVGGSAALWSINGKGNQDPCPAGYRVAGFSEVLHAYRDYSNTGTYYKFSHYLVGNGSISVGSNTGSDNYGGYHQSSASNDYFVWLPSCGIRISYMTNKDGAPVDPSARSEQGAMYMCGFFAYDTAATLTSGRYYYCGIPDVSWTPATVMATTSSARAGWGADGVYLPAIYMTLSGNPYRYTHTSGDRCLAVSDALPVRCVKMQ